MDGVPPETSRSRRLLAAAIGLLVFAAAGVFAWRAFERTEPLPKPSSTAVPRADPLEAIPAGWTELPAPPEIRSGSAAIWAGGELIDWGGSTYDRDTDTTTYAADGFAFDPVDSTWRSIPPAPSARAGARGVWTGTEALFLFGRDDDREFTDGLAFDPASETWRSVAASPLEGSVAVSTWTGTEAIVWGGGRITAGHEAEGAAYDPSTDTWRRIADAPHGLNLASGVWTGDELIVFGSLLDNRNVADTDTSVGAAYDPATDRWRELPPSQLSPQATSAVWTGDRMVAWDYEVHSQEYDPATDRWTEPVRMPLSFSECYPDSVAVTGFVFAWFCGDAALYDIATGDWHRIHGGMLEPTIEANSQPYQLWRFASLIPAGDTMFFEAEGITVTKSDEPCYGCSGSPTSFWVYRPSAPSASA